MNDPGFWWELVGRIGAPVFAATLVACLLGGRFEPLHLILLAAGLCMMAVDHWRNHHRSGPGGD